MESKDICRLCGENSLIFHPIFDTEDSNHETVDKILFVSSIQVFKGDGLPQNICDQCKYKLDAAYNFKIQILSTNEKLQVNYSIKISLKSDEEEFFEVKIENEVVNYEEEYENNEDISVQDIFQVELSQHDDNQKIFVVKNKKSKCRDNRKTQNNLKRIVTYEEVKQEYENNSDDSLEDIFEIESNEHISSNESETIGLVKNKKKKCGDNRKKRKNIARVCPECGRVLKMSSYYDHMLTQHNKEFKIECEICGIKLKTKRQLWHHKKKKHEEPEKISCDQCGLILASRSNFTRHYNNVHLGLRKHSCKLCGKCFGMSKTLKTHMRSHTGERPYICQYCNRGFSGRWALKQHSWLHTNEKPYKCNLCSEAFTQNVTLKLHIKRKHMGITPEKEKFNKINKE